MNENYKVYIKINEEGFITAVDSEWNIPDTEEWMCIDEGMGDKYFHAQGNYFEKPLTDMQGCHNYKYQDGQVYETTEEEKASELAGFSNAEPLLQDGLLAWAVDLDYRLLKLEKGVR